MAGIRVTAVAYSSLVDVQPGGFPEPVPVWCFIVLVTDSNAKPIAKLKLGNFSVKVHAKGVQGPVISPNL